MAPTSNPCYRPVLLEINARTERESPPIGSGGADQAKRGRIDVRVRIREYRMIQDVHDVRSKFEGSLFINPDSFDQIRIQLKSTRGLLERRDREFPTLPGSGLANNRFPLASYIALLLKTVLRVFTAVTPATPGSAF